MNEKDIRKSVRKYIFENFGKWTGFDSKEMMGAAKQAAMQDIKSSGEEFVDLGKSKFEKDLSIEDMLNDLENAKQGKTGMDLKRIQKQIDQMKRFGGGSLNEFEQDEFEGPAKEAAKKDIKASGEKFVDLGKSRFEKNLDKEKFFDDLKNVNEENLNEYYFVDNYADELEKKMDKTKQYTEKEFLDLFTQKHALQHSDIMNALKSELKDRGFSFVETTEEGIGTSLSMEKGMNVKEDSLEFRKTAGQRQKTRKDVPLGKHAPHSQATLKDEGAGVSLTMKRGMNVKPTNGK